MLESRVREQEDLFVACSLRDLIPDDHILKQVDRVLDLSWVRDEVRGLYVEDNGRPGIDPEAAVRLMLAGFFHGYIQDRRLLREAQVNLAIRWFAGYRLDEVLPHHSAFTRIRQRWGAELFKKIFERTVAQCIEAGLVSGETIHIDATLIRANASMESLVRRHAESVWASQEGDPDDPTPGGGPPVGRKQDKPGRLRDEVRSRSDPDATLAKGSFGEPARPRYKQHTAVDDKAQIIVDVSVTTGAEKEGAELLPQVDRIVERLNRPVGAVTADTGYGTGKNYAGLEARGVEAVIPTPKPTITSRIPISRFRFDERHNWMRCPRGRKLLYKGRDERGLHLYRASRKDCGECPLAERCLSARVRVRTVKVGEGYAALLRARRKLLRHEALDRIRLSRHRWMVEGAHGEGKEQHGLGRAVRRGHQNVRVQVFLTAAVMNLKRLARIFRPKPLGSNSSTSIIFRINSITPKHAA
jgi:transposase